MSHHEARRGGVRVGIDLRHGKTLRRASSAGARRGEPVAVSG
jgi:hypothetical protein